ncbi:ABC transporter ATP-binding protein [Pelagibius sp.]|uniref:ABC transporter ATP-binding protein n=1 Tax=Pelagibius sp. TaxID=1931238 RepID=UPI003BB12943
MTIELDTAPVRNEASTSEAPDEGAPLSGSTVTMKRLSKTFGPVTAVDNVSLEIAAGEFVSLLGPSGSGKTTILMMLAGFEAPSQGGINIAEQDVTNVPPYARDIGMVFQSYALFPHMTVFENIAYPLKLRKLAKAETDERVIRAMDMVKMPAGHFADRFPQQLSGGQRQRVALVRALVYEPRVLLMDEPMGALDKNLREELKLELIGLQERLRLTIVYVTHDQGEALMLSDRVAVMKEGRIEQIDHPEVLYRHPRTAFVANFLGEANLIELKRRSQYEFALSDGQLVSTSEGATQDPSRSCLMMVRPENIELCAEPDATVVGRVENTVYLGNTIRAEIATPVGPLTVMANPKDSHRVKKGQILGLRFSTVDPVLVPKS